MSDQNARTADIDYPRDWREWCKLACTRSVVVRGLKLAVIVGSILIGINHGDAIVSGELSLSNYVKMGLTVVVPYFVSVLSSVGAMVENGRVRSTSIPGSASRDLS